MPIEFRCPQCEKLLRVPDESAGAKAKCPQCGGIADVPQAGVADALAPSSSPFSDGGQPVQPAASDSANPYSSPSSGLSPELSKPSLSSELVPTRVDAGSVLSFAWEVWKANLGILLGITVVVFGVNIGFSIVQNILVAIFEQQGQPEVGALLGFLIAITSNFLQIFLGIGQAQIALRLLRGQRAEFGDLFGGGSLFLRVLGASILAGLAMMVGIVACVVPGILLMLFFWPFYWLIIDEKATAIESFAMARPFAQENVGTAFVLWLASAGIMLAGMLALCVGILFAAPLVTLTWSAAYLMMTGQLTTKPPY